MPIVNPSASPAIPGVTTLASVSVFSDVRALQAGQYPLVVVLGGTTVGDGYDGVFYWSSTSLAADDALNTLAPNAGGTGRWIRLYSGFTLSQGASKVSVIQSGTGAVSTDIQTRDRQVVYVTDFAANGVSGAKCDPTGVTDSALGIQAAINSITVGTVVIPAGTFKCSTSITPKKNVNIVGDGYGSVISYTGAGVAVSCVGSLDSWHSVLRDFRITSSTGTHGLRLKDLARVELRGLTISGFSTAGLHLTGTAVTGFCINITINGNTITSNSGKGVLVDGVNAINQIAVHGNRVQGNTLAGISMEAACTGWSIAGNDIEGNGGTAELYIDGGGCAGLSITGNYFESSTNHPAILAANTQPQYGIGIQGNFFQGDLAITNAITLGVSAFVYGVVVKGNAFTGAYTNAISPAAVIGGDFGPNYLAGAIVHVATPGGSSVGIRVLNSSGTVLTLSGRESPAQGATVASANNLALGADGNRFQISGTTQINLIDNTNWQGGSIVTLHFQGSVTVKHNQGASGNNKPIKLAGSVDFAAAVSNQLTLQYDSTDSIWYEIARVVA
jgi:hypothetical protein